MSVIIENVKDSIANGIPVRVKRNNQGYQFDEGNGFEKYLRVSTFLDGVPKPAIAAWGMRSVAEFAWEHRATWPTYPKQDAIDLMKKSPYKNRDRAAEKGTAVHNALEAYVKKEELPELTKSEQEYFEAGKRFLDARQSQLLGAEIICVNKSYGYAGTFDLWTIHNGETWLLDYKTSKGVYPNNALQLTAYQKAEWAVMKLEKQKSEGKTEVWTGTMIPWIEDYATQMGVVHVTSECATLYPVRPSEMLWSTFRAAGHVKHFMRETDSSFGKTPRHEVFESPISYGDK